jgi:hypothetical protein
MCVVYMWEWERREREREIKMTVKATELASLK